MVGALVVGTVAAATTPMGEVMADGVETVECHLSNAANGTTGGCSMSEADDVPDECTVGSRGTKTKDGVGVVLVDGSYERGVSITEVRKADGTTFFQVEHKRDGEAGADVGVAAKGKEEGGQLDGITSGFDLEVKIVKKIRYSHSQTESVETLLEGEYLGAREGGRSWKNHELCD